VQKTRFMIKEQPFPDWYLDDEKVEKAAKSFLKKEDIKIVSWKKLGVVRVRTFDIEVNYEE